MAAIATGAMAAALAGTITTGVMMPIDGAQATALAGTPAIVSSSALDITGAACQAVAGNVTAKIVVTQLNPNYIARGGARQRVAIGLPRSRVAVGARRNRVIVGISNAMAQTNNLSPPIDAVVEEETVTFDYGILIVPGVTLTGTPTVTCEVYEGEDADPSSRLVGEWTIGKSPNTGEPDAAVYQIVGTMLAGVTYRLQCVCRTTDGQNLSLWNHISCQAPD